MKHSLPYVFSVFFLANVASARHAVDDTVAASGDGAGPTLEQAFQKANDDFQAFNIPTARKDIHSAAYEAMPGTCLARKIAPDGTVTYEHAYVYVRFQHEKFGDFYKAYINIFETAQKRDAFADLVRTFPGDEGLEEDIFVEEIKGTGEKGYGYASGAPFSGYGRRAVMGRELRIKRRDEADPNQLAFAIDKFAQQLAFENEKEQERKNPASLVCKVNKKDARAFADTRKTAERAEIEKSVLQDFAKDTEDSGIEMSRLLTVVSELSDVHMVPNSSDIQRRFEALSRKQGFSKESRDLAAQLEKFYLGVREREIYYEKGNLAKTMTIPTTGKEWEDPGVLVMNQLNNTYASFKNALRERSGKQLSDNALTKALEAVRQMDTLRRKMTPRALALLSTEHRQLALEQTRSMHRFLQAYLKEGTQSHRSSYEPPKMIQDLYGVGGDEASRRIASKGKDAIPMLLDFWKNTEDGSKDEYARLMAMRALREIGRDAVPTLVSLLSEKDFSSMAANQLASMSQKEIGEQYAREAVPKLLAMMQERRGYGSAILALGKMGKEARPAIPELVKILEEAPNNKLVADTVKLLGGIAEETGPLLLKAYRDKELGEDGRAPLVNALIAIAVDTKVVDPYFFRVLSDRRESDFERVSAILIMSATGESAIPQIVSIIKDKTETKQAHDAGLEVLLYLSKDSKERVLKVLENLAQEKDQQVSNRAKEHIRSINNGPLYFPPQWTMNGNHIWR